MIELKPEWIIHNEDGTESVKPYPVLDELAARTRERDTMLNQLLQVKQERDALLREADEYATRLRWAVRGLESIATGKLTGVYSHKETVEAMRQIARGALADAREELYVNDEEPPYETPCPGCGRDGDSVDCPHDDEAMQAAARQVSLIGKSNPSMYAIGNMTRALWIAKTAVKAYLDAKKTERCPICDWPMAATAKEGCVPGNCSYRGSNPALRHVPPNP